MAIIREKYMSPQEESREESALLLDLDQPRLGANFNKLVRELPITDGQKVLMLCRGTWESVQGIVERNQNGHLYVALGPGEKDEKQITGWTHNCALTFLYSRLTELPLPNAFLDRVIVVYSAILFNFKQPVVKEVCRVLKPGGIFYVLYFDVKEVANTCYFEIRK